MSEMTPEDFKAVCIAHEFFETPRWAADAILKHEFLSQYVLDPCAGSGILCEALKAAGYGVLAWDVREWGYPLDAVQDFLVAPETGISSLPLTVFMNPPFSLAEQFVEKSFAMGARKIVMFQRFAFWESKKRRPFWEKYPPNRIYICGERADCWRHDVAADQRGSGTPTAHAWFVFERGHPPGTLAGHIYKEAKDSHPT